MVKGNLILISSDIPDSLSKILPTDQQLLPVSLKRKLQYHGSFLEEWVDVKKVQLYFAWFKENNPLFMDVELNEDLIDQFQKDTMDGATQFETLKDKGEEVLNSVDGYHEHESETEHDECEECLLAEFENNVEPMDQIEAMNQTSMFANIYEEDIDLPTVANKLADIIVELEKSMNLKKNHDDDFLHEYVDLQVEQENMDGVVDEISSFHPYPQDEVYLSDETDLLNTAMKIEGDKVYFTDEDEDQHDDENAFHLSFDVSK